MSLRVVVLPIFQRQWLCHAWLDNTSELAAAEAIDWRQGQGLREKFDLFTKNISSKFQNGVRKQWDGIKTAKEGTFQNKLYQLAQFVLSREDPDESFLKQIPNKVNSITVIYPASLQEVAVRRRLRRLALQRQGIHQRNMYVWSALAVPQLPLMLTPLPNVTLYYTVYRMVGNYGAWQGARTLDSAFRQLDTLQLYQLCQVLGQMQKEDPAAAASLSTSWQARLMSKAPKYRAEVEAMMKAVEMGQDHLPLPVFKSSKELDIFVKPQERWYSPLGEEAVVKIGDRLHLPDLLEHYARIKRKLPEDQQPPQEKKPWWKAVFA